MPILKNHSALIATPEVIEICRPLKKLGVDFFCYHRIFTDDSEIMLSNNAEWVRHYYTNTCTVHKDAEYAVNNKIEYFIWPYHTQTGDITDQAREISNILYGMSFVSGKNKHLGYLEGFGLALSKNIDVVNPILTRMELLKQFCTYFQDKASKLIESCTKDKIINLESKLMMFAEHSSNLGFDEGYSDFLAEISLNTNPITWKLTAREIECIDYLLLGQTASETAKSLHISVRTVETHLDNIKSKLHCTKKSELIAHLIKMGFSPSAQLLQL